MSEIAREFQGVWIPREIWLNQKLDYFAKALWAELNSLDHTQKGCTASNQYLCKMMGVPERTLQRGLAVLKKLGFIRYTDFNGRQRTVRTYVCPRDVKNVGEGVTKMSPLGRQKCHPEILDKILDKNPPPLPPQKDEQKNGFLKKEEEEEEFLKPTEEERKELDKRFKERKSKVPVRVKKSWEKVVLMEMREQQKAANEAASHIAKMEDIGRKDHERFMSHKDQAIKHHGSQIDFPHIKNVTVKAHTHHVTFCTYHDKAEWGEKGVTDYVLDVDYSISDEGWEIMTGWKKDS